MEIFPNSFYEASIHLYQHQRELSLEKELQIDPAILLLGFHLKNEMDKYAHGENLIRIS